jgi:AcrR family transcriptional regulator
MPGRSRDADLDKRLLDSAWSLLKSDGYHGLTLTKAASRAGAHRSDVYRRWPGKPLLVIDVLNEHLPPVSEVDTGALGSDIRAVVEDFAASWSSLWIDGLVGLIADLQHDPAAELAFRRMAVRRGTPVVNIVTRAVDRGELSEVPDLSLLGDMIEGPLMHRRMIGRQPLTPAFLDAVAFTAYRLLTGNTGNTVAW